MLLDPLQITVTCY